jgi:hypothetical protein
MTQAMTPTSLESDDPTPPRGMSDEEELRRWGQAVANEGVGETIYDMTDDMRELGLMPDDSR